MRFLGPAARRKSAKRHTFSSKIMCILHFSDPMKVGKVHFDTFFIMEKCIVLHRRRHVRCAGSENLFTAHSKKPTTFIPDLNLVFSESGNGILAYDRFRVPSFSGTRKLKHARIDFPLSGKSRNCNMSKQNIWGSCDSWVPRRAAKVQEDTLFI